MNNSETLLNLTKQYFEIDKHVNMILLKCTEAASTGNIFYNQSKDDFDIIFGLVGDDEVVRFWYIMQHELQQYGFNVTDIENNVQISWL